MPELYRIADAMLVTLEDKPYANMTIPGKVQSYMAACKPIIDAINGSCSNFITNNEILLRNKNRYNICTEVSYSR